MIRKGRISFAKTRQHHWTADRAAKLVALKGLRLAGIEIKEISSIQGVVAKVLDQFTVIFVGARSRGDVDDRARVTSVLGAEGRVVDPELLNAADRAAAS